VSVHPGITWPCTRAGTLAQGKIRVESAVNTIPPSEETVAKAAAAGPAVQTRWPLEIGGECGGARGQPRLRGSAIFFSEDTATVLVSENGAVIRLAAAVVSGPTALPHGLEEPTARMVCQVVRKRTFRPTECYVDSSSRSPGRTFGAWRFPRKTASPSQLRDRSEGGVRGDDCGGCALRKPLPRRGKGRRRSLKPGSRSAARTNPGNPLQTKAAGRRKGGGGSGICNSPAKRAEGSGCGKQSRIKPSGCATRALPAAPASHRQILLRWRHLQRMGMRKKQGGRGLGRTWRQSRWFA